VATSIAGRIEQFHAGHSAQKPTSNLSAYECLLRGQQLMHKYTRQDYADARGCFEQAIALDPAFARAYGWLACVELYDWFWDMTPGGPDRAILIGGRGLHLDDHDSRCHLALGVSYLFRKDHDKAGHHLGRAASLNPNDDLIMVETGRFKMYIGAPDEGAELVRRGMRQNPYHPNWYWNILARCLHTAGRYEEAIAALEHIETPQFWNYAYLASCYAELGEAEKARENAAAVLEMKPDFSITKFAAILPYRDPKVLAGFFAGFWYAGLPE
jgi:adenylate cyclase